MIWKAKEWFHKQSCMCEGLKDGFWIASQAWKENVLLYDAYLIGDKKNFHVLASSGEQVCNHEVQQL